MLVQVYIVKWIHGPTGNILVTYTKKQFLFGELTKVMVPKSPSHISEIIVH